MALPTEWRAALRDPDGRRTAWFAGVALSAVLGSAALLFWVNISQGGGDAAHLVWRLLPLALLSLLAYLSARRSHRLHRPQGAAIAILALGFALSLGFTQVRTTTLEAPYAAVMDFF